MRKILITGAKGQLGLSIKRILENDSISIPDYNFLFTDIEEFDITNLQEVKTYCEANKPEFIINCGGYTNVDGAESDVDNAFLANARAVENITSSIDLAKTCLIHISTDYVFDGSQNTPYIENDTTCPASVYGSSKLKGEEIALQYKNTIIIRTSWLYSEFGKNFALTILKHANEKNQLNVVFDQIGTPTYASDLARAIITIIQKKIKTGNSLQSEIYHFSNEGVCSWYDFAQQIVNVKNIDCRIYPVRSSEYPTVAKRPSYSVLDKSKIKIDFDITIPNWLDSLSEMLNNL